MLAAARDRRVGRGDSRPEREHVARSEIRDRIAARIRRDDEDVRARTARQVIEPRAAVDLAPLDPVAPAPEAADREGLRARHETKDELRAALQDFDVLRREARADAHRIDAAAGRIEVDERVIPGAEPK